MFTNNKDQLFAPQNIFIWFVLAFQGGTLNVGGYLAVHRFVSHVTGFATLFGVNASSGDWANAFGMLAGPLFYLMGTMTSAWFIERPRLRNQRPSYKFVFSFIIFNLMLLVILGKFNIFGPFGEEFNNRMDYVLLFILALTCGLQNAVISSASGAIIRTTHLTGPTTDLGIGLVHWWTDRHKHNKNLVFQNLCRIGIIISFILGSLMGAYLFKELNFIGFGLPIILSMFVMIRLNIHKE